VEAVFYVLGVVIFLVIVVDVWRSPAETVEKIVWSVFAFLCSIITLVVWFAWGRQRAYGRGTAL
jgi:hypothetical protein